MYLYLWSELMTEFMRNANASFSNIKKKIDIEQADLKFAKYIRIISPINRV